MPAKGHTKLSDQLRTLIETSGVSRYEIAKSIDVDESALCRFCSGERGVSTAMLDKLGAYFDLEIQPRRQRPGRPTTKRGD